MRAVTLGTYTVDVRRRHHSQSEMLKFEPGEKGGSAHAAVLATLTQLAGGCNVNEDEKLILHVTRLESDSTDIFGIVKRGEYGAEVPIFSSETGLQTYIQTVAEAAMLPFYFRFHLPPGATKGILVM